MENSRSVPEKIGALSGIQDISSLASGVASIFAVLITFCLVLSAVHEYAYFINFDRSLISILAPIDYLRQSIEWLPFLIIGVIFAISDEMRLLRFREAIAVVMRVEASDANCFLPRSEKIYRLSKNLIFWLLFVPFCLSLPWFDLLFFAPIIYVLQTDFLSKKIGKMADGKLAAAALLYVCLILMSFAYGLLEGGLSTSEVKLSADRIITLKIRGHRKKKDFAILRYLDRGVLVKANETIQFFPWSSIDAFEMRYEKNSSLPRIIKSYF